ncbi:MAG TPA: type II CAAX endopeptidase family protein [Gaiellaceae bacterium]|nr:type II CAAX endopeptidase family protein [Gaiellaceae bacterium]
MKERSGTAPPYRRDDGRRLALWLALVAVMVAIGYGTRASAGKPDPQVLYEWTTAIGALVQDGIVLFLVLAIAGFSTRLLALRPPRAYSATARVLGVALVAIYLVEIAYGRLVHVGNEQGLTPNHWEPRHAAAYIANAIVICTWVPFVEELTYRGLGYSLLERFGRWPAIVAVGLLFGLAHGLIESLPVLAVFGGVLAWIRSRTGSVYPGMVLHSLFNLVALVAAVTLPR